MEKSESTSNFVLVYITWFLKIINFDGFYSSFRSYLFECILQMTKLKKINGNFQMCPFIYTQQHVSLKLGEWIGVSWLFDMCVQQHSPLFCAWDLTLQSVAEANYILLIWPLVSTQLYIILAHIFVHLYVLQICWKNVYLIFD